MCWYNTEEYWIECVISQTRGGVTKRFPSDSLISYFAKFMMTSSNWNIFCVTGHLCGEFTGHRWIPRTVTRSFDVSFVLCLNKRKSKQSRAWWFETSRPLWCRCNDRNTVSLLTTTLIFESRRRSLAAVTHVKHVRGSPGHRHQIYWLCGLNGSSSSKVMNFNYMCHVCVEKW